MKGYQTRILVVNDNTNCSRLISGQLERLTDNSFQIFCLEKADLDSALDHDIFIINSAMEDAVGMIQRIRDHNSAAHIVLCGLINNPRQLKKMLQLGIDGFYDNNIESVATIAEAIERKVQNEELKTEISAKLEKLEQVKQSYEMLCSTKSPLA